MILCRHVCCRPPAEFHLSIYTSVYYEFHVDILIITVVPDTSLYAERLLSVAHLCIFHAR